MFPGRQVPLGSALRPCRLLQSLCMKNAGMCA